MKIVQIDHAIGAIPLFRIDIPSSSERVRLSTQVTRMETNHHVKLRQELRPVCLAPSEHLGRGEILKILVVGNHIYRRCCPFEVVPPDGKGREDGEQFLVVRVIVELGRMQGARVECNRM